ncbi:hypothetical protein HDV05_007502 [Chytridiales sp. JEL 0842]|nr:hypothetical protein HDV05_007502 [Chytridiales sp. JEL 0842]
MSSSPELQSASSLNSRRGSASQNSSARQRKRVTHSVRSATSAEVAKVLNEVLEGSNYAYRNGRMTCDRNCQTEELDEVSLQDVDHVAKDIRKDLYITQKMLQVKTDQKLREAHQVLYQAMTDRLQAIAELLRKQLWEARAYCTDQMKRQLQDRIEELGDHNYDVLKDLEEKQQRDIDEKQQLLDRANKILRTKDEERQKMKFTEVRFYLLLKKHKLIDREATEAEDAERLEMTAILERYQMCIRRLDRELASLKTQIKLVEDYIDSFNNTAGSPHGSGFFNQAAPTTPARGSLSVQAPPPRLTGENGISRSLLGSRQGRTPPTPNSLGKPGTTDSGDWGYNAVGRTGSVSFGFVPGARTYGQSRQSSRVGVPSRMNSMAAHDDQPKTPGTGSGALGRTAETPSSAGGSKSKSGSARGASSSSAEQDPREKYRARLIKEWEARIEEALEGPRGTLEEIKKMRTKMAEDWESRLKSVEALQDDKTIRKMLKRQERLFSLAKEVAVERNKKKLKVDQNVACHLHGLTLAEYIRKQDLEWRKCKRHVLNEIETKVRRRFEDAERARWRSERTHGGLTVNRMASAAASSHSNLQSENGNHMGSFISLSQKHSPRQSASGQHDRSSMNSPYSSLSAKEISKFLHQRPHSTLPTHDSTIVHHQRSHSTSHAQPNHDIHVSQHQRSQSAIHSHDKKDSLAFLHQRSQSAIQAEDDKVDFGSHNLISPTTTVDQIVIALESQENTPDDKNHENSGASNTGPDESQIQETAPSVPLLNFIEPSKSDLQVSSEQNESTPAENGVTEANDPTSDTPPEQTTSAYASQSISHINSSNGTQVWDNEQHVSQEFDSQKFWRSANVSVQYYSTGRTLSPQEEEAQRMVAAQIARLTTPHKTKQGIVKGLAGVAISKPKHLPPMSMGIEGAHLESPAPPVPTIPIRLRKQSPSPRPPNQHMTIDESFYQGLYDTAMSNMSNLGAEIAAIEKMQIRPWSASSKATSVAQRKTVEPRSGRSGAGKMWGTGDLDAMLQGVPLLPPLTGNSYQIREEENQEDDDDVKDIDTLGGTKRSWTPMWTGPTQPRQPTARTTPPEGVKGSAIRNHL